METQIRETAREGQVTVEPDLLTLDDLAKVTGWGKTKLYEDARAGSLPFPALRKGRRFYFSRRAYENWRDSNATA